MEEYIRIRGNEILEYAHMIPDWLLASPQEGADVQFFGMRDFGIPCGAAVLSGENGVLTLQYLYLAQEYRGSGRGTRFLGELLNYAYHAGEYEFQVKYIPGQYPEMERILQSYPFQREEEMIGSFSCTLKDLQDVKHLQGGCGNVRALSECTEESLRPFYREVELRGEDMVEMPVKKKEYLAAESAVAMENGCPAGLLLVKQDGEGAVTIPFMINLSANIAAPIEMIRFAVQAGGKKYPPETTCSFAVVNETLLRLLEKMGITFVRKRQKCTLALSYFERYEEMVQHYLNGEINSI